jgi:cobalt-zinc-cadmium efflux system protein
VFAITLTVLAIEIVGAITTGSLALLADAGHMAADAAGIGLSLFAVWIAGRPAGSDRTYGYYRAEILAAVINAMLLFGVGAYILVESVRRLLEPSDVTSGAMIVFGLIAVAGNAVSLLLLRKAQAESLNIRGAFLEVLSDMLGSVAVVVAAVVVATTGYTRADAIASMLIGVMILPRTWHLLRDAIDVLLEATPRGTSIDEVRQHIIDVPGVEDVHDLHVWTITSGMPVISAHVVMQADASHGTVLDELGRCLAHHFDIEHSTFQLEPAGHQEHEGVLHD